MGSTALPAEVLYDGLESWGRPATIASVVEVPTIYAPPTKPIRIGWYGRLLCLAIAAGCVFVMWNALTLRPSRDGLGTHRALGFLPCSMLVTTGLPCPTCGMTTSFAWFYRGNLLASVYVQPAGFLLAIVNGMLLIYAVYEGFTGRPIHRLARYVPTRWWLVLLGVGLAFGWAWKIMIHLTGHDGW